MKTRWKWTFRRPCLIDWLVPASTTGLYLQSLGQSQKQYRSTETSLYLWLNQLEIWLCKSSAWWWLFIMITVVHYFVSLSWFCILMIMCYDCSSALLLLCFLELEAALTVLSRSMSPLVLAHAAKTNTFISSLHHAQDCPLSIYTKLQSSKFIRNYFYMTTHC